jgi:hypothetical protein
MRVSSTSIPVGAGTVASEYKFLTTSLPRRGVFSLSFRVTLEENRNTREDYWFHVDGFLRDIDEIMMKTKFSLIMQIIFADLKLKLIESN